MKLKKPASEIETLELDPTPEQEPEPMLFVMEHDDEAGTVEFQISDGTAVTLKSPTKRQLWAVTGWTNSASEDERSDLMLMLKITQICCIKWGDRPGISFDELSEQVEPEDLPRLGAAIACFRDRLEPFFTRLRLASAGQAI
jgi:hypothetical protein